MLHDGYNQVEGIKVSDDKRTRLNMIYQIYKGRYNRSFLKLELIDLITQLIGFGKEYHDDCG